MTEAAEARARGAAQPVPVIIVDEAHRLAEWEDKKALQQLLDFFVHLTKEACLAHVVLATSDAFLASWLDAGACARGRERWTQCCFLRRAAES